MTRSQLLRVPGLVLALVCGVIGAGLGILSLADWASSNTLLEAAQFGFGGACAVLTVADAVAARRFTDKHAELLFVAVCALFIHVLLAIAVVALLIALALAVLSDIF